MKTALEQRKIFSCGFLLVLMLGTFFSFSATAQAGDLTAGGSLSAGNTSSGGGSCRGCSYSYFDIDTQFAGVKRAPKRNRALITLYCSGIGGLFKQVSVVDNGQRVAQEIANVKAAGSWESCARKIFANLGNVNGTLPANSCLKKTKPSFCTSQAHGGKEQSGGVNNFYERQLHGYGTNSGVTVDGNELQNYKKAPSSLNIIVKELNLKNQETTNVLVRSVDYRQAEADSSGLNTGRGDRDCEPKGGRCTNTTYYGTSSGAGKFGGPILGGEQYTQGGICSKTTTSNNISPRLTAAQLLKNPNNAEYKLKRVGGILNGKTCAWSLGVDANNDYEIYEPKTKSVLYEKSTFRHGPFSFAISVATNSKGELTSFRYYLNGRQDKAYLVQVFGLSGREYITHYTVHASMDSVSQEVVETDRVPTCATPPCGTPPPPADPDDEVDITEDGNTNQGLSEGSSEDPPPPFLSPQLVMNLDNAGYVKTGKASQWSAYAEQPDGPISGIDRAIFLRKVGFRLGDSQVYEPNQTEDGQTFFGPNLSGGASAQGTAGQAQGTFTIRTDNATSAWQQQKITADRTPAYWHPLTNDNDRKLIKTEVGLAQRSVDPLSSSDNMFKAITSSLIPNQSEDEPQYGEMQLVYEQGRFVNDVDLLSNRECPTRVERSMRGTNADLSTTGPNAWITTPGVSGAVAQGFMFHQVATAKNFGYVCRFRDGDNYDIRLQFASPLSANAPATLPGTIHYSDYGFGEFLNSVTFHKENATTYKASIPMKSFQNNQLLSDTSYDSGYLVTVRGIENLPPQWRMTVTGNVDPQDIVQWAGISDRYTRSAGLPEGSGFGPDYDPFSPNSGSGTGLNGSSCQLGGCTTHSNIVALRVIGNTPGA